MYLIDVFLLPEEIRDTPRDLRTDLIYGKKLLLIRLHYLFQRTEFVRNKSGYMLPDVLYPQAEDEPDVRTVLASTLSRAGYEVIEAASGDDAFTAFKQTPDVDLLLTDIVMPGALQGTDLANAIRCMSPDLPVVFLSGYDAESAEHGTPAGSRDIRLSKPVSRAELIAAVERSLGQRDEPNGAGL